MYYVEDSAGNLRANVIPSESELSDYYAHHFPRGTYARRGKAWQGTHRAWRLRSILRTKRPIRILDFGCGHGQFLGACRRRLPAAELVGFEMSPEQCASVQAALEIPVFCDQNKLHQRYSDGFDLITLWHVLEHTREPGRLIARLFESLRPGGRMILAVPNRSSLGMRVRREKWAWCQAPYIHLWHFSLSGLRALIESSTTDGTIQLGTREAWDCNFLVDGLLGARLQNWPPTLQRVGFRLDSALRLSAFAVYELLFNPLVFAPFGFGAELVGEVMKSTGGHRDSGPLGVPFAGDRARI